MQINNLKPKNPIERKSFLITESDKRLKLHDIYTYKEGTRPRQKHENLLVDIDKIVDFFLSAHLKDTRRSTSEFNLKTILQKDGLSLCFLDIVKKLSDLLRRKPSNYFDIILEHPFMYTRDDEYSVYIEEERNLLATTKGYSPQCPNCNDDLKVDTRFPNYRLKCQVC